VSSLRLKIFLAMGALVVAVVALLGFLSRDVTRSGLNQIVELAEAQGAEADRALARAVRQDLEQARRRDGDFRSAAKILQAFHQATGGEEAPGMALFDEKGALVAGVGMPSDRVKVEPLEGAEAGMIEARWTVTEGGRVEAIVLRGGLPVRGGDGHQVATLLPIRRPSPERVADRTETLVRVDRRLVAAAVGVTVLALLLGGLLARRIVRPVEALAHAAHSLGRGNLGSRVPVRSHDELGRLGRAFNDMASALERAETLRRQMVAGIAHELRTPLAALRAQLEAIQDGLAAPTPEAVASLVEDAVHLGHLVDDLQDLALADAGRLVLDRRSVDLGDEVRGAARSLGLAPEAGSGSGLELDLPADLPPVSADPRRLRQILVNLLENARVHGASGTPERPIRVSVRPKDRSRALVRLTVRDHGPGIPIEELPRIVERFHRADPARGRASGGQRGTGLGLAITRALVELHGGTLHVADADGGGIEVAVTLPAAQAGDRPARAPSRG